MSNNNSGGDDYAAKVPLLKNIVDFKGWKISVENHLSTFDHNMWKFIANGPHINRPYSSCKFPHLWEGN